MTDDDGCWCGLNPRCRVACLQAQLTRARRERDRFREQSSASATDALRAIRERDEALAKAERIFTALVAAQDSHTETMRERDEAREMVADLARIYEVAQPDEEPEIDAALKRWGMR